MEILTYTDKEILGLIPAQMLIDSDRARKVIEGVAKAEQRNTLKQLLSSLNMRDVGGECPEWAMSDMTYRELSKDINIFRVQTVKQEH